MTIPLELYTRVEFEVTGDQREQNVGAPLPPTFIPVSIDSTLPTRLDPGGSLTVQLRPGRHVVTLRARHPEPLTEIGNAAQSTPWPSTETWVFEARNNIRVVEIEGVQSVDPRQTRVPEQWRHLPAFVVPAGDAMQLVVTRRGDPEPEPDKLRLTRELWLDFDGSGYTTHDHIAGRITRNWRLDSGADLDLGQVVIHGEPQFITRLGPDGRAGVEVRRGQVDLRADGRMGGDIERFGVTGWTHDFHDVQATLKLPPGWDVFAIGGVDNIPDTWLNRWTLLDLFLVLIVSAAVLRLWHWRGAVVALITTALIWNAPDAPRYVWIHLLVAIALLRVLPPGKFKSLVVGYRNVTALVLILISIPFVVQQLRAAAYPQLAQPANYVPPPAHAPAPAVVTEDMAVAMEESPAKAPHFGDELALKAPASSAVGKPARRGTVGGGRTEGKAGDVYRLGSGCHRADRSGIAQLAMAPGQSQMERPGRRRPGALHNLHPAAGEHDPERRPGGVAARAVDGRGRPRHTATGGSRPAREHHGADAASRGCVAACAEHKGRRAAGPGHARGAETTLVGRARVRRAVRRYQPYAH